MSLCTKWWLGVTGALMLVLAAQAEPVAQLKATDYINDFAQVLDQNSIASTAAPSRTRIADSDLLCSPNFVESVA